jgi:hypothetical protein
MKPYSLKAWKCGNQRSWILECSNPVTMSLQYSPFHREDHFFHDCQSSSCEYDLLRRFENPGQKYGNLGAGDCKTQMKNTHRNINVTYYCAANYSFIAVSNWVYSEDNQKPAQKYLPLDRELAVQISTRQVRWHKWWADNQRLQNEPFLLTCLF